MIKGIIFDFDGVIIESEDLLNQVEIGIFNKHGLPLTSVINKQYLGYKIDDYISALEERFRIRLNHQQISSELHNGFESVYTDAAPLVKGIRSVLDETRTKYKIALATSREKHLVLAACERLGIQSFEHGVYKENVTKGKPDPEVFLKAAILLGLAPKDCVVIEDAESGFRAARAAGMQVIARKATHNKLQDFSLADFIIEDYSNFNNLLAKLA